MVLDSIKKILGAFGGIVVLVIITVLTALFGALVLIINLFDKAFAEWILNGLTAMVKEWYKYF